MVEEIHYKDPILFRRGIVEVVKCSICERNLILDGLGTYGDDVYVIDLKLSGLSMRKNYVCGLNCLKKFVEISIRERETERKLRLETNKKVDRRLYIETDFHEE